MVVVQNQNELVFHKFENFVDENVNGAFRILGKLSRGLLEIGKHCLSKTGDDLLDTKCEIPEENEGIRVCMIKLIPNKFALVCPQKVRNESGLSGSCVCGY
jgi:hypothetical protein